MTASVKSKEGAAPRLPAGVMQLGVEYSDSGATFTGTGFGFEVGAPTVGRSDEGSIVRARLERRGQAASYVGAGTSVSYRPVESGIDQTFTVSSRPGGSGPVVISVPVAGLRAESTRGSIQLVGDKGQVEAAYSGLLVRDAKGHQLGASMTAGADGATVRIAVDDSNAAYPITVDPTWSEVTVLWGTGNGPGGGQVGGGQNVAISGSLAVVGEQSSGAAYVFTRGATGWAQTGFLLPKDGASADEFGFSVAIYGTTIIVGAPGETAGGYTHQGAAYAFVQTGSTWDQAAEWTESDGSTDYNFGVSVAVSGSGVFVGAGSYNSTGSVYVFGLADQGWAYQNTISSPDGVAGHMFASAIAVSGSTLVVGEYNSAYSDGVVYVYTFSGGSWSQPHALASPDGVNSGKEGVRFSV